MPSAGSETGRIESKVTAAVDADQLRRHLRTAERRDYTDASVLRGELAVGVVGPPLCANVGETIHVLGRSTNFTQAVHSMQIEHAPVVTAPRGASVGIKLIEEAREHDRVFKVGTD